MLSKTAKRALAAYGGENFWNNAKYIQAEVSVKGLAFTLKRRPFFEHAKIEMEIWRPYSRLTPIGKNRNISGILDGNNVRLEDERGNILAERKDAVSYFSSVRRLFYWDDLDMAYFANYAFWNYFTLPSLLMNKEIEWKEKSDGVLEATFPRSIPTHSKKQEFQFDIVSGRLFQHNYTAEIISKFAKAGNVVTQHSEQSELIFPSSRQVTPRTKMGKALKRPILIDITVHKYEVR